MTDDELATELCDTFWPILSPGILQYKRGNNSLDRGGWLAALSRARELLTGTTARAPNNDREQCALQMAWSINPYSNWHSLTQDGKEAAYRCADLALSWIDHVLTPAAEAVHAERTWKETPQMRFADVLQQAWVCEQDGSTEWRDVPRVVVLP